MKSKRIERPQTTALRLAALVVVSLWVAPALAQPTAAQQDALRKNCRSDFMSHCAGVSPGGKDALECLQKNVAGLSPGCQTAVRATMPPPPAAETKPPAPPATKSTATETKKTPTTTTTAPSAKTTSTKTTSTKATSAKTKVTKKKAEPPPTAAVAPPTSITPPTAPEAHPPKAPILTLAVTLRACKRDLLKHCRGIEPGGGRRLACLAAHEAELTVRCKVARRVTKRLR